MFSTLLAKLGIKGYSSTGGEGAANKLVKFNSSGLLDPTVIQVALIDHEDLINVGSNTHAQLDTHVANTANPHSVTKTQVGLGNCDNTSDANKPISTLTQAALDLKSSTASLTEHIADETKHLTSAQNTLLDSLTPTVTELNYVDGVTSAIQTQLDSKASSSTVTTHTSNTSNPHSVTKTQVGLGNCDNTSDANKPISTLTQAALDLKAALASPAFTGTPTAPTALVGTNTTQVASTAFVKTAIDALVDGAPGALDTLNEISTQLSNDADAVAALTLVVASKVPATRTINTHDLTADISLTKSDIGLGNCDNTSDANKPVSTATQTALDLKASASDVSTHIVDETKHLTSAQNTLLDALTATATELNYVDGVTSAIQTQLDGKASTAALADRLLAANNLADLIDVGEARTSLGLAAGAVMAVSSQLEAEAGADNNTLMTPLRTAQAIAALAAPSGITVGTTTIASGTSGKILYNNSGLVGEKTTTGTGDIVLATAPTLVGATVASGTLSASAPIVISQTWNNAAVAFTGLDINITETAAAGLSTYMRVRSSRSSFDIFKLQYSQYGTYTDLAIGGTTADASGITLRSGYGHAQFYAASLGLYSDSTMGFVLASTNGTPFTYLTPTTAKLFQRNSTTAQSFNVCNTYTSVASYEGITLDWSTNVARVGTTKGGSGGSARSWMLHYDGTEKARVSSSGFTVGASGTAISSIISATDTLNFDLTSVVVQDLNMTVTGAVVGDVVALGYHYAVVSATAQFSAWVSATNTVTVRCRTAVAGENPGSGTFRATIIRH